MSDIVFDVDAFRTAFPAFANKQTYPDVTLSGYWDVAAMYISTSNYGYLSGAARGRALDLMTAHIARLAGMIAVGQTPGLVQGSTIDKISVTLTPPPASDQFTWWLNLTNYGAQLAALLAVKAVGGFYVTPNNPVRGLR
jgi:hypothetical protein